MAELKLENKLLKLPILPLKNMVALPKGIVPVKVARPISVKAVKAASSENSGLIFVTCQKSEDSSNPKISDLYQTGITAKILQISTEPGSTLKILLEGVSRAKIVSQEEVKDALYLCGNIQVLKSEEAKDNSETKAIVRNLKSVFKEYISLSDRVSPDLLKVIKDLKDIDVLSDSIAIHLNIEKKERQDLLENLDLEKRALKVSSLMQSEIEILKAEKSVRQRVQSQMEKHQRDYYLNEQVRAIYRELGRDDILQEIEKFRNEGKKLKLSKEAMEKLLAECRRLEQMQPTSPEATVSRSYIEWLLSVPWYKKSRDRVSLSSAQKILESSHAGMEKPKERIIEFVAAKKFAGETLKSSPIICLVGPPGVGKTSLAKSISKALGRSLVQISLGGLRDEAEIRGHRRTYIGSMPGKIINAMKKAKVVNPVVLLDEIDKMSMDFRGDPSSALLEVLDPEQNKQFVDHFLEVEYDISNVIFIATANVYDNIPYPLLDRMEIISLSGYTEDEKLTIANKFLIPELKKDHSIKDSQVALSEKIIRKIISEYTREAGVRSLSRLIAKVLRKCIQTILDKGSKKVSITEKNLEAWLGSPKYKQSFTKDKKTLGVSTGLAWTEVGGDLLEVEIVNMKGKGGLTITGQLGEVMQESAQASLSYIRSKANDLGLKKDFYADADLHIHVPEGSIPKDGPSAGITIASALISVLKGIPVDRSVAMSGEITLQGRVLAVGGLKEKILAAIRFGIKKVIVPEENKGDIKEFEKELPKDLKIIYVTKIEEVLENALVENPFKKNSKKSPSAKSPKKKRTVKK